MKLLLSLSVFALALLSFPGHAQTRGYRYSRPLDSLKGTWHHVELPPDMYRKVNESLTDIRILGVTDSGDTIEAPYILKSRGDAFTSSDVSLSLRNRSSRGGNFYVTVVMKEAAPINELELGFDRQNFEWRVMLEGSTDEKAWYVILSATEYCLSIMNRPASNSPGLPSPKPLTLFTGSPLHRRPIHS